MNKKNLIKFNDSECKQCGACCKYLILWLPEKVTKDYLRWLNYHEGIKVITCDIGVLGKRKAIRIESKCSKLTKDGKCSIYKRRPKDCRDYNCWSGLYPKP